MQSESPMDFKTRQVLAALWVLKSIGDSLCISTARVYWDTLKSKRKAAESKNNSHYSALSPSATHTCNLRRRLELYRYIVSPLWG